MKKSIFIIFILIVLLTAPLFSLGQRERSNLAFTGRLYQKKADELAQKRQAYADYERANPDDPKYKAYLELSRKISYLKKKSSEYFKAANNAENTTYTIIKNTIVWTAEDLSSLAGSMWEEWDTVLLNVFTGNYLGLVGTAVEKTVKLRIQKNIIEQLGSSSPVLEDYIYYSFVEPKVDWQKAAQLSPQTKEKALSLGKQMFTETVKEKAAAYGASKLKSMGKRIMASVGSAIDIVDVASDVFEKVYFFYSSDKTVELMLYQIGLYMKRENLDVEQAFLRYLNNTDQVPKNRDYMKVLVNQARAGQKILLRYYAHSEVIYKEGDMITDPYVAIFRSDLPHGNEWMTRDPKTRKWLDSHDASWEFGKRGYVRVKGKNNPGVLLYEIPKDLPPGKYELRMHYTSVEDPAGFMWSNPFYVKAPHQN